MFTTTVLRWSQRYLQVWAQGWRPGVVDMDDRSSRPHRSPARTLMRVERRIRHLRIKRRFGAAQIAGRVGVPASTVCRVSVRSGLNRLDHMARGTGEVIRRYERAHTGELVHVDVKKFGLIPAGDGWRVQGRTVATAGRQRRKFHNRRRAAAHAARRAGYAYVHSAVDDRFRMAYSEVHDDKTAATATGFWLRACAFFASHGLSVREVLTDNGVAYRAHAWKDTLTSAGTTVRCTRPYRPQTNGRVERCHRTLRDEWGYGKTYRPENARRKALTSWLHIYKHHRPHSALGGKTTHHARD